MQLYNRFCVHCHGAVVHSGSAIPDLRFVHESRHKAFQQIVLGGPLADRGMGPFSDVLNADQVEAIHADIIDRANATLEAESGPKGWRSIRQWSYERLVDAMLWFN